MIKKLFGLILLTATCLAQTVHTAGREVPNVFTQPNQFKQGTQLGPITFSSLGTIPLSQGTIIYILDASQTSPCTGSGTGAVAIYTGGVWNCSLFSTIVGVLNQVLVISTGTQITVGLPSSILLPGNLTGLGGFGLTPDPNDVCALYFPLFTYDEFGDVAGQPYWIAGANGTTFCQLFLLFQPSIVPPSTGFAPIWNAQAGQFQLKAPTQIYEVGALQIGDKIYTNTQVLSSGTAIHTFANSFSFTSPSTFGCTCTDQTAANACKAAPASATTVTLVGTGADTLWLSCSGH